MEFSISLPEQEGCPAFDGTLRQTNVFLGTNGSGKSKLLDRIANTVRQDHPGYRVVQTIGGRSIELSDNIGSGSSRRNNIDDVELGDLEEGWRDGYTSQLPNARQRSDYSPQHRFSVAVKQLAHLMATQEQDYKHRFLAWGETDRTTPAPFRRPSPIQSLLDLFTEVFPEIKISTINAKTNESYTKDGPLYSHSFSLQCLKNGQVYPVSKLSDGEKQIFASLADRYFLRDTKVVFVVDEPELNLDPQLACDFWSLMEREMPASAFIYATHSLDFALRKGIDTIWTIGQSGPAPINREQLVSLPPDEQRRFLGGIRGILAADMGVVVEGNQDSIDSEFYPWLLKGEGQICVRGYGGCDDVFDATKKLDIWKHIAPSARLVGVIDRDYRTDTELSKIAETGCLALDFHDAEAYFCHPAVLLALAKKLGRNEFPDERTLKEKIVEYCSAALYKTVGCRMARRCRTRRQVSIPNERIAAISSDAALIKVAAEFANLDQSNPPIETSPDFVKSIVREELKLCKKAIDQQNIDEMLRLFNGKDLLSHFATLFRFTDGTAIAEYASQNLEATDFAHLKLLKQSILEKWSVTTSAETEISEPADSGEVSR